MTASDVISLLSLGVAVFVSIRSVIVERRQADENRASSAKADQISAELVELKRQLLSIEHGRERDRSAALKTAELRARLEEVSSGTYRFVLMNQSAADAENVKVSLDGTVITEHESFFTGGIPATLAKRSQAHCILVFHNMCSPPFDLKIEWSDESRTPGNYATILNW